MADRCDGRDDVAGRPRGHTICLRSRCTGFVGNEFGAPPTLPQSGTATYTLVGYTDPTDTLGNTGVLGAASLSADFPNRVVRLAAHAEH